MTNRRGFFQRLLGAAIAPIAAKCLPEPKQFESGVAIAHAYRQNGHTIYEFGDGLGIRFIRSFDNDGNVQSRMDVLYGGAIIPSHASDAVVLISS